MSLLLKDSPQGATTQEAHLQPNTNPNAHPEDENDNDVPVNKKTTFNGRLNQYFHISKSICTTRQQKQPINSIKNGPSIQPTHASPRKRKRESQAILPTTRITRSRSRSQTPTSIATATRKNVTPTPTPTPTPSPLTSSDSLLRDTIPPNLTLLLVGVNPGILTGTTGYAYAHPSNLFWKLLHWSGITPIRHPPSDTYRLPELYNIGNTNIVERPTRDASMLSKAEMDAGVPVLEAKVAAMRPEVVCLVGKSIWEAVWRVRRGRGIKKEEFRYGWQGEGENMGRVEGWEGARVFVATTTSGLAAGMSLGEKREVWEELGRWVTSRREEKKKEGKGENI